MTLLTPTLLDELLHEKKVMELYGHLFADRELQEARRDGLIEWHSLRKGPHYSRQQLADYLNRQVKQCSTNHPLDGNAPPEQDQKEKANGSSKSGRSGSPPSQPRKLTTIAGMTSSQEEHAAALLDAES